MAPTVRAVNYEKLLFPSLPLGVCCVCVGVVLCVCMCVSVCMFGRGGGGE